MIKALQFLSDKNQSFSNNYLLVGDNDFLYLFIKNQIVKKLQKKDETFVFDCADKSDSLDQLMNVLGSQDLFSSDKLIIIKNINKLNKKNSELLLNSFPLERDRKLCTDGARWRPPAAGDQRMNGALRQLLLVGQVLSVYRQTVAVVSP